MKPMHIAMALLSAAMFFVLAGVFMGVQLELDGTKLVVDTASDVRWQWVFIGTAVVFFFQLLRPAFQKGLKSVSGPKFILPAIDGSTVKQKLFLVALLVLAVAWPFMVSRGTVDIATLTMIYIILPQALKNVLPALANEFIVLLKETSVSGYIAIQDLTKGGDIIRSQTYNALFPLLMVAAIYLIMVLFFEKLVSILERRLRNSER